MPDAAFVAQALAFGSLIGFSLGAPGAGGSILTVPILVYAMGVPVQGATGASLAIVGLTSAVGALDYLRRGRSLQKTGIAFGASGILGALAGVWLNHQLRGELILLPVSIVMVAAAFSRLRRRAAGASEAAFDERYPVWGWARLGAHRVGRWFSHWLLRRRRRISDRACDGGQPWPANAAGRRYVAAGDRTQCAVGTIGNLRLGTLDWPLTLLFAAGGLVGVFAGSKLAGKLPDRTLRVAFALLIVGVAVYTFGRSLTTMLGTGPVLSNS
ncbi:MAG: sulfite exporter TauE/SafE family protein [Chloroflexota bacterium]|nr:sulfite exporter TauE/SafE family protein [Chloroflexota bacterium]